jgi:Flp pilus assembly protein TadG
MLRSGSRRGSNILEFALILPWYIFLFVGAFDYGFFSYGLIATQNAARVSAMYCSASSSRASNCTNACGYVLDQLRNMPNVGSAVTTCTAAPVVVSTSMVTGTGSSGSPDGSNAATVTVTYTTPQLIPIPGLLPGILTIARTATMKALT